VTVRDARSVVRDVRITLASIVMGQALILGTACGTLCSAVSGSAAIGWLCTFLVAIIVAWRSRTVWSMERVALWIEERDPELQYALVTAVDPRYVGRTAPPYSGAPLRRAGVRALGPAVLALIAAVGASRVLVAHRVGLHGAGIGARPNDRNRTPLNRLTPLAARVVPPAYSHLPTRELAEPSSVASLVGSEIVLHGRGDTTGVRAMVGATPARVEADGGAWRIVVTMPVTAALVKLTDGPNERLVVLAPVPDAPPTVELTAPARDSVMRVARGMLALAARAADDIGLADGHFEVIVTAGSEESGGVQAKTLTVGRVSFADDKTGTMVGGFALDSLKPGDVVSIRAVVRDGNTVSGPGVGTSETRTYRLATKEEYDSLAVEGAPPPGIDSSYMSQRMIVIETQALLKRMARRLPAPRDTVVAVSRRLGEREDRLKSKVEQILHGGDGGVGEAMSAAERVLFDTAFASMTDASMNLAVADPKGALPRELVALAVLDTVRMMQHRLYLRGKPPTIVVNLARVRMSGTSKPDAGVRVPGVATDTLRRRLADELGLLVRGRPLLERPRAADSLTMMQVGALALDPALATAFGEAASALRGQQDPVPALARARRLLSGAATADTGRAAWAGGGA
jgi:hypothetical protein